MFVFPGPDTDTKRILPFFENVVVKESKAAKLVKYNPIGRSSNSFGYTGADSRKLSLAFNITLPNIASIATMNLDSRWSNRKKSIEDLQSSFFSNVTTPGLHQDSVKYEDKWRKILGEADSKEEFQLLQYLATTTRSPGLMKPGRASTTTGAPITGAGASIVTSTGAGTAQTNEAIKLKYRLVDTIVYWTNLIRSSVLNNSKNPFYGPPIVRLTYGVLYQDIPCVCASYRITADGKAGYDQRTMLPRVIGVTMELFEVREGDRGHYTPGVPIERDNLTGWESIINSPFSTDPMESL